MNTPTSTQRTDADQTAAHAALFDAEAARYDAAFHQPAWAGHSLRSRHAAVVAALDHGVGTVLDAGMGPGHLCRELANRGWTVSGVDVSAEMVARSQAKLPEAARRLREGDLRDLPFPDGSFDAVVASGVLDYVPDIPAALRELARVLQPGGTAVLTMPNPRAPYFEWRRLVVTPALRAAKRVLPSARPAPARRKRPPTPTRFARMLEETGLRVDSVAYTSFGVLLWPLDELLPGFAARVAQWLERRRPGFETLCATQVVVAARKP